jgi:hypothetical protein
LGAQLAEFDTQQLPPQELEKLVWVECQPLGQTVPHWKNEPLFLAQLAEFDTQQLPPQELEKLVWVECQPPGQLVPHWKKLLPQL